MRIGTIVRITKGPFAGLRARLAGPAGGNRISVVAELHGIPIEMEMDLDWIVAEEPDRKPVSVVEASRNRRWRDARA